MNERKVFLYFIIFVIWIFVARFLEEHYYILFSVFLILTSIAIIITSIKNGKIINFFNSYISINRKIKKLNHWNILEDNKISYLLLIKNSNDFRINLLLMVTFLILVPSILIATYINVYIIYALFITYLLYFSITLLKVNVNRFPITTALVIPFISILVPVYLHDTKFITNLLYLKLIYIGIAIFIYLIMCLFARPYAIQKIHRNLLFINGLPNLLLLILTITLSTLKKPKLNFTNQEGFNRLPNELQTLLSDKYFTNQIRDIFFQSELNKLTSEISTDILIATIVIFIFTIILKTLLQHNQNKARKKLNYIRFKELLNEDIAYEEYQTISYFGGEYYEDLILTMPNALNCIYLKEKDYIKDHTSVSRKIKSIFAYKFSYLQNYWKYVLRKLK
jgi:hypothetical protein